MKVIDNTIGMSSNTTYQCGCDHCHAIPLTAPNSRNKMLMNNSNRTQHAMEHDTNVLGVITQYYNGVGPSMIGRTGNLLDLPNSINFHNYVYRRQSLISKQIIEVTTREIEHAFNLEVKETVIHEKGLDFYEKWLMEDKEKRQKI